MFIVHGSFGSLDVIVATTDAGRAVAHYNRLMGAGLDAEIADAAGRACDPCLLPAVMRTTRPKPRHGRRRRRRPLPNPVRVRT